MKMARQHINVIARAYTMTLLSYMNMLMYNQMEIGDDLRDEPELELGY